MSRIRSILLVLSFSGLKSIYSASLLNRLPGDKVIAGRTVTDKLTSWVQPFKSSYSSRDIYGAAVTVKCDKQDYAMYTRKASYADAAENCYHRGGHLAIFKNQAVWACVKTALIANNFGGMDFWFGLTRLSNRKTEFLWADGEPLQWHHFANWHPGQPDNVRDSGNGGTINADIPSPPELLELQPENCAHIWSNHDFTWNDHKCRLLAGSICQID